MTTTTNETTDVLAQARLDCDALLNALQTVILGSVNADGKPDASYTPAILDHARNLYVYVSALSRHTANLRESGCVSAMIIEDESAAEQLFARRRLTFDCTVEAIERHCPEWETRLDAFEEKFGGIAKHLRGMADFDLFRLKPQSGRLVTGFGRAFDVEGEGMQNVTHVRGINGQGHVRDKQS
ncbi:MAG: HugZ family protein [Opitutales bacterium]